MEDLIVFLGLYGTFLSVHHVTLRARKIAPHLAKPMPKHVAFIAAGFAHAVTHPAFHEAATEYAVHVVLRFIAH